MLRLKYSSGEAVDDPPLDEITSAIQNIDPKDDGPFIIVEDLSFENAFMQTRRHSPRWFIVEYRDDVTDRQYRTRFLVRQPDVEKLFRWYVAGDESYRTTVTWDDISEYLLRREKNPIQKAIATLSDAVDSLKKYQDASPVFPEEEKLYRTFNDSIVYVISVDDSDEGSVIVLRGGHGIANKPGEKPGETYAVDPDGFYQEATASAATLMSLRQVIELSEVDG